MPDDLKQKVAESAEACGRSLHAELLVRLNESFRLNKADADNAGALMQLAESKLVQSKYMGHALHLAHCVEFLLQAIRGPDPKGALSAFPDLFQIAEKAAEEAKAYEVELNPRRRLKEYEEAIGAAEAVLQTWRTNMLPWPGDEAPEEKTTVASEPVKPIRKGPNSLIGRARKKA